MAKSTSSEKLSPDPLPENDVEKKLTQADFFRKTREHLIPYAVCFLILFLFSVTIAPLWKTFGWPFCIYGGGSVPIDNLSPDKIEFVQRLPNGDLTKEMPAWIAEESLENYVCEELKKSAKVRFSYSEDPNWSGKTPEDADSGAFAERISIYDDRMLDTVCQALGRHMSIRQVKKVEKFYPPFLRIEVEYAKPTLLVLQSVAQMDQDPDRDISENTDAKTSKRRGGLIDSECNMMQITDQYFARWYGDSVTFPIYCGEAPDDFLQNENKYFQRADFDGISFPASEAPKTPWPNRKELQAAVDIVLALGDRWEKYGMDYLCSVRVNDFADTQFCLVTRYNSRILWGEHDPEKPNTISNAVKVQKLDEFYRKHGSLDTPEARFLFSYRLKNANEE